LWQAVPLGHLWLGWDGELHPETLRWT
jgi:hypothetical protein